MDRTRTDSLPASTAAVTAALALSVCRLALVAGMAFALI